MTLEHRKIEIIQEIAASNHEELIKAVETVLQKFSKTTFKLNLSRHKNIEKSIDLNKIKAKRPLIDFSMEEFIKEANDVEWNKSIDELLMELD